MTPDPETNYEEVIVYHDRLSHVDRRYHVKGSTLKGTVTDLETGKVYPYRINPKVYMNENEFQRVALFDFHVHEMVASLSRMASRPDELKKAIEEADATEVQGTTSPDGTN